MVGAVVMTVSSDRPSYLRTTLDSWKSVRLISEWPFRFHIEPSSRRSMCVDIINQWIDETGLSDVDLIYNSSRLGVLRNPWHALENAFVSGAEFALLAEEDIIVSSDILEYVSEVGRRYCSSSEVLAICASNFGNGTDRSITYLAPDFCPLIWGTWSDRWFNILRDTWDLDYSTGNADGSQAGWDWNIKMRLIPRLSMVCAHAEVSRALHIGEYGVHMLPADFPASQARNFQRS